MTTRAGTTQAMRWPTRAVVVAVCACLTALWSVSAPAARASGHAGPHRAAGKVFVTNDAAHSTGAGWTQAPDQDLARTHRADPTVRYGIAVQAALTPTLARQVHDTHSRGPPA